MFHFQLSVNILFYISEVTNKLNHRIISVTICFLFNNLSSDISVFIYYTGVIQQNQKKKEGVKERKKGKIHMLEILIISKGNKVYKCNYE